MANYDALQAIRNGAAHRQSIFQALDRDGNGVLNELAGAKDTNRNGHIDFKTEYTVGVEGLSKIERGYFSYSIAKRGITLNLSGANLSGANLFQANLFRANLFQADLFQADLSKVINIDSAHLVGARGISVLQHPWLFLRSLE